MRALLTNKVEFKWTQKCQEAIEALKEKLTTTPRGGQKTQYSLPELELPEPAPDLPELKLPKH
jgi:hypothetical protein